MLPVVVALRNQPVLVVGAGKVAAAKIKLLLAEGAQVTVVTSEVLEPVPDGATVRIRPYESGDLRGFRLAIVAVGDATVNQQIRREADELGILLNVVDTPDMCDFFFTAVHREDDVVISVSTQGAAPALAQLIRDHIARTLPPGIGALAASLRQRRLELHQRGESTESTTWKAHVSSLFAQHLATNTTGSQHDL